MEEKEIAIAVCGVKKTYRLGEIGGGTLQKDLQSLWARLLKKDDPNRKLGSKRISGETLRALDGIDLTVREGERLGIIGRNGAGKSTLLKLLAEVTAPTEGDIYLCGRVTSMLEVGTGFHSEMTGRENIYMNGSILGMTRAEIDAKMEDIIDFSEVRPFIDTPVKRYSSGMFVKLAFAVAAHLDSEIMIMDEVLAVGDVAFQKKCLDKMKEVAENGNRTILYVSHNMNTIRRLCSRCIVMDEGKIIFDGDPERAIEIYMGGDLAEKSEIAFSAARHSPYFGDDRFRMDAVAFDRSGQPVFECGSVVGLTVTVHTEQEWHDIGIRFEIKNDEDKPIGTMLSEKLYNFEVGDANKIHVDMDTQNLPPGKYAVDIVAFAVDDMHNDIVVDGVYPGMAFQISDALNRRNFMRWIPTYWGPTRLSDLHIEKMGESLED